MSNQISDLDANLELAKEEKKVSHNQPSPILAKKLKDLAETSTSHGLPNIVRTNRLSIKLLWTICLLASVGACIYMVYKSVNDYYSYGVVTQIQVINENSPLFPTITICNINPFSSIYGQNLIEKVTMEQLGVNLSLVPTNSSNYTYYVNKATSLALIQLKNPMFNLSYKASLLDYSKYMSITNCFFNETGCGINEFQNIYDVNMGNCIRFNSGYDLAGSSISLSNSLNSGRTSGLRLQIFLFDSENKYFYASSEGLRVFVHNSSFDIRQSEGADVALSMSTSIAIQRTFVSKHPDPYSDCKDLSAFNSVLYKYFKDSGSAYRQIDCFDLCLQKKIIQSCSCYDLRYPQLFNYEISCSSVEKYDCSTNVTIFFRQNQIDNECLSNCPLECDSVQYDLSLSSSSYPSRQAYDLFSSQVVGLSYEQVKSRTLELNIYYAELSYTKISESPQTSIIDLFSNIGGTMGLYVGVSFLSFVEIVEALLEIIFISFNINI